eukprot:GHVH01011852.1.p1 GENE.GHVH01011852.1~~GHVH01011852.1.p1  ORF type:complete len:1259 (+),score=182.74 GHVH01011852.1:228-4004(+)
MATTPQVSEVATSRSAVVTSTFFRVEWNTVYSQTVVVVGNCPELGDWDPHQGVIMQTSGIHYPCWYTSESIQLRTKVPVEYKYCVVTVDVNQDITEFISWEDSSDLDSALVTANGNRLTIPQGDHTIVEDDFGKYRFQFSHSSNKPKAMSQLMDDTRLEGSSKARNIFQERRNTQTSIPMHANTKTSPVIRAMSHTRSPSDRFLERAATPVLNDSVEELSGVQSGRLRAQLVDDDITSVFYVSGDLPVSLYRSSGAWAVVQKNDRVAPSLWENRHKIFTSTKKRLFFVGQPVISDSDSVTEEDRVQIEAVLEDCDCIPVWLEKSTKSLFESFTWKYLWHIFHCNILTTRLEHDRSQQNCCSYVPSGACPGYGDADRHAWEIYKRASNHYVAVLMNCTNTGDIIWFNDLYCLIMPQSARPKLKGCILGLFFHVPFPSSEVFRTLPSSSEILQSILSCDTVAFHFFEYARHFLVACKRLLAVDHYFKAGGTLCIESSSNTGSRLITICCYHATLDASKLIKSLKGKAKDRVCGTWKDKVHCEDFLQLSSIGAPVKPSASPPSNNMYPTAPLPAPSIAMTSWKDEDVDDACGMMTLECILNSQRDDEISLSFNRTDGLLQDSLNVYSNDILASPHLGESADPRSVERRSRTTSPTACSHHKRDVYHSKRESLTTLAFRLRGGDGGEVFHFVGVDRLSTISSLRGKFKAFYTWLEQNEHSVIITRVMLRQYCYQIDQLETASSVRSLVKDLLNYVQMINKRFGKLSPRGVVASLEIGDLDNFERIAIFLSGDCYINTCWRDGLCLDPYEYIMVRATTKQKRARLILSEFVGSSSTLSSARRVNPWDDMAVVEALSWAYQDYDPRRWERAFQDDFEILQASSVLEWARTIMNEIEQSGINSEHVQYNGGLSGDIKLVKSHPLLTYFDEEQHSRMVSDFRASKCRVIFLDHEGTLTESTSIENQGLRADGAAPAREVISLLNCLAATRSSEIRTFVVVMSGRAKCNLDAWFKMCGKLGLAAEHGFFIKYPNDTRTWRQTHSVDEEICSHWKNVTKQLMESHVAKTYGAKVENKGSAITFQYRNADPDFGMWSARELEGVLRELLSDDPCEVLAGKGYVEVRQLNVNKGTAVMNVVDYIREQLDLSPDFFLAIGDDRSDEDMFKHIIKMTRVSLDGDSTPSYERGSSMVERCGSATLQACTSFDRLRTGLSSSRKQQINTDAPNGEKVYTCTVGRKPTAAQFFVNTTEDVKQVLRQLARVTADGQ